MPDKLNSFPLLLIGILLFNPLAAQEKKEPPLDTDELYAKGRQLIFDGKREEGRAFLQQAIELSPTYWEIRLFSARTLAWDGLRDSALVFLKPVLDEEPGNREAWVLKITVINWDDRPSDMLTAADSALKFHPNDLEILLLKARALIQLEQPKDAGAVVNKVLDREPGNKEGLEMAEEIRQSLMLNTISVGYSIDGFSRVFGPAQNASLSYSRRTKPGSLHFRLNGANRFDTSGFQPEIDFYPGLGAGFYAYLNYGYSNRALYPLHRFGAELYKNIPGGWEASAGLRYLHFDPTSRVDIYTATLGKYIGSWWISARTFLTPDRDLGATSKSVTLQARFYVLGAENYFGASAGLGYSPDDAFLTGSASDNGRIYYLKSRKVGLSYQKDLSFRTQIGLGVGYAQRELPFDIGTFVEVWSGSASLSYKF